MVRNMTVTKEHREYKEVETLMHDFFRAYYSDRNAQKLGELVSEDILYVGLGPGEFAAGRPDFERFVQRQTAGISESIQYFVEEYRQTQHNPALWSCYSQIALRVRQGDWGLVRYVILLTATVARREEGWKIVSAHVSEVNNYGENQSSYVGEEAGSHTDTGHDFTGCDVDAIIDHMIPGGVISRVRQDGYPIESVNSQFLNMCGYSSLEDFRECQENSFLKALHPDDVPKYIYTARFIGSTGKQYACEYRLRRKNGSYVWLHDVCRMASLTEDKELLVSVVTDMSEQLEYRHKLETENGEDFLTGIFNRKGAKEAIEACAAEVDRCMFLAMDLDNFKQVNDLYGHLTGDQILQYMAKLLREIFGQYGIVCRLGGDEFFAFLPEYESVEWVREKLQKLSREYMAYIMANCPNAHTTVSVGGVYGHGGADIRGMYQKADANLYRVKNSGKGSCYFTDWDA